jgi:hypothetical protein
MNAQQGAFLRQARSDWQVYNDLCARDPRVGCHELHYLQMATEKFAKAYWWGTSTPPGLTHSSFAIFMRDAATKSAVRQALGLAKQSQLRAWVRATLPLIVEIENLAPTLAQQGPNPEYPWPPDLPTVAPVDYAFDVLRQLETPKGKKLLHLIDRLLTTFDVWG